MMPESPETDNPAVHSAPADEQTTAPDAASPTGEESAAAAASETKAKPKRKVRAKKKAIAAAPEDVGENAITATEALPTEVAAVAQQVITIPEQTEASAPAVPADTVSAEAAVAEPVTKPKRPRKKKKSEVEAAPSVPAEAAAAAEAATEAVAQETPVAEAAPETAAEQTAQTAADMSAEVVAEQPDAAIEESAAGQEQPATTTETETAETSEGAAEGEPTAAEGSAPARETDEDEESSEEKVKRPIEEVTRTVEALLFAAEEPVGVRELARASGSDSATVRKLLPDLKKVYDEQRRPWDIAEVAGGYRLVTRPEFYPAIQRLKTQTAQRKLTQAALETLALIAYRQPIGRADIESVRGVGAGPVLRLLLEKKLIKISGRGTGLGQPLLYGTTDYFLEHFGLKSIQDLPKPAEFKGA
ncbi:MAG TPA: SMC-Scp complex subunit ScpB [Planctomycetota bacterium]|jgi:segregation and condensation protein B